MVMEVERTTDNKQKAYWNKLSDEKILHIEQQLKAGVPKQSIVEEMGISNTTLYRYAKEFGYVNSRSPKKARNRKSSKKSTGKSKSITKVQAIKAPDEKLKGGQTSIIKDTREVLECGSIKDRHDGIPTDLFIFDNNIGQFEMFNYDYLDRKVRSFITSNIEFVKNDTGVMVGNKDLVVYMTGLVCVASSICKVCQEMKVNLTLMHWNNTDNDYHPQVIWKDFCRVSIRSLFPISKSVTMRNCTYGSLNTNDFYYIDIVDFESKNKNLRDNDTIICKSEEDMWEAYGEELKTIMLDKGTKKNMYAYKAKLKDAGIEKTRLQQISNFR